jgi:hypothetical protein
VSPGPALPDPGFPPDGQWRLVPCSADWPDDVLYGDDEYPGDLDLYEDPDCAPPAGLDDAQLAALMAGRLEAVL